MNKVSDQNIIEGNILISEFMGCKLFDGTVWYYLGQDGFESEDGKFLKYHSNWDWLMPVLEKIQRIDITPPPNYQGYRIEIVVQGYVKITGAYMPQIFTNVSIEGSLIKAIWKAVTIFIVWYNQNKKNEHNSM